MKIGLLAALVLFAFSAASAAAATTFKVNTTADENLATTTSGPCENDTSGCTLRAAVELAVEGGEATIDVPARTYIETQTTDPSLTISEGAKVTIVGEGAGSTIIEGEDKASVFEVREAGSALTLDGVTVRKGGDVDEGGGIFDDEGSVTVESSIVTENEANDVGGGIFASPGSTVAIKQSALTKNDAGEVGVLLSAGGALFTSFDAEATIEASTLDENGAGFGGATYTEGDGVTNITGSTLEKNFAFSGGAVYVETDAAVQVSESTLDSNAAELGGAISEEVRDDDDECDLAGAAKPHGQSRVSPAVGGDGPTDGVTVEASTIDTNEAERGGGVYVGPQPEVCDGAKQATHSAGAHTAGPSVHPDVIEGLEEGSLTVVGTTIEENEAVGGEDGGRGGGIYSELATTTITQKSTVSHNTAGERGGGMYGWDSFITIGHSTVDDNTTTEDDGGGIAVENEELTDECFDSHSTPHADASTREGLEGTLTVEQSTIDGNIAGEREDGDGGGIYATGLLTEECGIEVHAARRSASEAHGSVTSASEEEPFFSEAGLTIEQSTIAHNAAGSNSGGDGGGIYEAAEFDDPIVNTTIADNTAGEEGGGVYSEDDAGAALISDTVDENTVESDESSNNLAGGDSGAIELRNTIVAEKPGEHEQNCEGNVVSLVPGAGYNLDYPSPPVAPGETGECGMSSKENDLVDTNPALSTEGLHENGGPTETIALLASSPAIGVVPIEDCESSETGPGLVDQRGDVRPGIAGDLCDIGAYEYQGTPKAPAKPAAKEETKKEEPKKEEPAKQAVLSVKITSPLQCASKRAFTIHIQNVKQFGIVSATVSIDGKHKRTLTGSRLKTAINLRGLPKGTFTVEIVAHTRSGQTLHGKRVYHTCHLPLPGQSRLRL
jgi:CSLREA domain-containing protein